MDKALIHSIIEHTKLSNTSSVPIEISQVAYMQAGLSRAQLDKLNADVVQLVGLFIDDNAEYDESQLEIVFNMHLKDEIEYLISELASKYECNPKGIVNFIVWAVYRELAKLMFNRGFILRGIDCYTLQKQAEIVAEATGGRSFAEIKDIGRNLHIKDKAKEANAKRWQGHVEQLRRKYLELDVKRQKELGKSLFIREVAMWIYNNHNPEELELDTIKGHVSKARKGQFTN